jgi:DNA-binding CsgD family transcriptional regulator/tetratricopeptide (TPR) repeat protein
MDRPAERRFVGRHAELQTLQQALQRAVEAWPGIVLLAGEPGIGKTRTAQQMIAHAAQQGVLALWGRCPEEAGAPPYWPWVQLMRRWIALHEDAEVARVFAAAAPLASLDAQFAPYLPQAAPDLGVSDPAQARFRLFDAVAGFWQRAALRQPLLLVFDDLHRADVPSLKLLEFVMAEAGRSRLLVLGSYRDAELSALHPLSQTLLQLQRHAQVQRLLLGGFSAAETAEFVAAAGLSAPEWGVLMHERSEGHPLFLAEMVRDLLPSRAAAGTDARIGFRRLPNGVREIIGERLAALAPPCLDLLQRAAVIGRQFPTTLLCRLADDMNPARCLELLHEARAASLADQSADAGTWQFAHMLMRDALYGQLPAAQCQALHRRVAEALAQQHADDPAPVLSALAHHWFASGDAAQAVDYATRAARHATAMLAHEEAMRLYRLAAEALPAAASHDAARCRMLLALGEAQNSAGDSAGALPTFTRAASLARRLGDAGLLAGAAIGVGNTVWRQGSDGTPAVALLQEALVLVPADDPRAQAALLSALCRALLFASRPQQAEQAWRQAVALARALGDPELLYEALSSIASGRWYPEGLALRIEAAREAIDLVRHTPHVQWSRTTVIGWHTGDLMEYGDGVAALAAARMHLEHSLAVGEPFNEATALAAQAMIATHQGRFADGEALAQQALRCGERFDRANAAGMFGVQMFTLRRHQGRLRELAPVLERFLQQQSLARTWRPGLAIMHFELGARDAARHVFEDLAADGFAGLPNDAIRTASLAYLAEVCAWLGDTAHAARLHALLLPYAGRCIVFGAHTASLGSADRLLGLLAATLQRWGEAQRHFETAIELDQRSGGRPWLPRTRCDFARMLLQRGQGADREQALLQLDAALEEAQALGLGSVLEQAQLLRQPLTQAMPAPAHPAGLSARELQVLRLVAAGKTNPQIAAELHRSPATVAIHVRNILDKTRSANRAEAAAFAARHGLLARE